MDSSIANTYSFICTQLIQLGLSNSAMILFSFFVLWHINLHRLFNANAILVEEQQQQ